MLVALFREDNWRSSIPMICCTNGSIARDRIVMKAPMEASDLTKVSGDYVRVHMQDAPNINVP
jgi:hypothetical protein